MKRMYHKMIRQAQADKLSEQELTLQWEHFKDMDEIMKREPGRVDDVISTKDGADDEDDEGDREMTDEEDGDDTFETVMDEAWERELEEATSKFYIILSGLGFG